MAFIEYYQKRNRNRGRNEGDHEGIIVKPLYSKAN